ncbi:MAG: hypothetical protein DSM106950_42105 [Stigonema ocellatum SAG 48.90 = DSM 106950]|nr:hypothetical protein [Stigonema ocellatum SAG 48.90 = DSM 106950]
MDSVQGVLGVRKALNQRPTGLGERELWSWLTNLGDVSMMSAGMWAWGISPYTKSGGI